MSIMFVALCLLAAAAWFTYALRERSGIHLLVALASGAMLGMAAIIAATLIVDIDPARFAKPLGKTFSVLLAVLVLSAVGWLVVAAFLPAVRASIAAHEVVHAVWFGAAISIGAFTYLYRVDLRSFLVSPNPWTIRGLQRPRYQGRNLEEWLPVLRTGTNNADHPLRIVRVIYNNESECDAVEVPVSWDLLQKYGLFEPETLQKGQREDASFSRAGKFSLLINGHRADTSPLCWRAANGNCLLRYFHRSLKPGTNEIAVEFSLFAGYSRLSTTGPPAQVVHH